MGVVDALVSVGEQVDDRGQFGGSLRRLYSEFLDHAGKLIETDLSEPASAYMVAAEHWLDVAAVARKGAERIAGVLDSSDAISRDEMADVFPRLSEAIHSAAKAERVALEALRVAVT